MVTRTTWGLVGVLLAGCGGSTVVLDEGEVETSEVVKQREAWASQDNPSLFSGTLEYRFDVLPREGEAARVPWAGSYWPTYEDNINFRWGGASSESPAKKYELAFYGADAGVNVEDAVSRAHGIESARSAKTCRETSECNAFLGETCAKRQGRDEGRCIATWWGICHAWAPAAILLPEPKNPVTRNGVTFQVQDLKALGSLVHNSTRNKFVSLRCNKHFSQPDGGGIRLDRFGRPVDGDRECRDTNAGTYHVLLANYLGLMKQSFVEDRTNDYEVWNQPLRSFKVTEARDVSAPEANRLVGLTADDADAGVSVERYHFNPAATRFVLVKSEVKYISESSAEDGYTAPTINWYTRTDRYEYVLELDAAGKVLGGEWVGSSKRDHPDFLWLPLSAGTTTVAEGRIDVELVKALVLESSGTAGAMVGTPVTVNESATLARGEWRHFGPFPAGAGPITVDLTGSGDADLYVRLNGQPSLNLYDCRPYKGNSTESCALSGPGQLFVSVHGYSAATVQLAIRYVGQPVVDGGVAQDASVRLDGGSRPDAGVDGGTRPDAGVDGGTRPDAGVVDGGAFVDGGVRPDAGVDAGVADGGAFVDGGVRPDAGVDAGATDGGGLGDAGVGDGGAFVDGGAGPDAGVAHLSVSGSVALGQFVHAQLPVTAGRAVVIRTTAPRDVDVYVKLGSAPSTTSYDARAWTSSGNETLRFVPPTTGTLFIGVHGYAASTFTLVTADQ
ncbi:MAG: hypothetical protein SFW67_23575 [Myxococcaceae bacterium]|nr:hypothetical protein [Myxococcaceae bacterium]